jgi:hypothetical protein
MQQWKKQPVLVAVQFKVWVQNPLIVGIGGLFPPEGMDVCLLCLFHVVYAAASETC